MARLYAIFVLILCLTGQYAVRAQSVAFEKGTWKDMLARAKNEKKLIFVDVYATWCGPCKKLDQQVFPDKQVATTFNAYFINYKIDAEHGEGLALARQYNVKAYPTALFIDGDGQLIDNWVGFISAPEFKQEGERVFRKTPLGLTLYLHETGYKSGNRSPAFMKNYLRLRQQAGLVSTDILNDYVARLPADSLRTPLVTSLVLANAQTCSGPAFELIMSRREEPRFQTALQIMLQNELGAAGTQQNRSRFEALCRIVERVEPADQVAERLARCKLTYYADAEDWKAYAEQADTYSARYLMPKLTANVLQQEPEQFAKGYDQLCNMGYFVSQYGKADARMSTLLSNLVSVSQLKPTPLITGLQACLRYRLGEHEEALALQTKALELARSTGDDVSGYEETLRRMQKKKSL